MARSPLETFTSKLATLAATFSHHVSTLNPLAYEAADGKTYYYATYQINSHPLPLQSEPLPSPLAAFRAIEKAIHHHVTQPTHAHRSLALA